MIVLLKMSVIVNIRAHMANMYYLWRLHNISIAEPQPISDRTYENGKNCAEAKLKELCM